MVHWVGLGICFVHSERSFVCSSIYVFIEREREREREGPSTLGML
jgi:hypothetical protein